MNRLVLEIPGFPFDMQTLEELQGGTLPFIEALSTILPNRCRVYGVVVPNELPGDVSDGMIFWDGELLPFKGGSSASHFSICEEVIDRDHNVGSPEDPELEAHPAYVKRWAEIGNIPGAESVHQLSLLLPVPKFLRALTQGTCYLGNPQPVVDPTGLKIDISFPNIGTSMYSVLGSFTAAGSVNIPISWLVKSPTATGFTLHLTSVVEPIHYCFFHYVIIPQ